MSDLQKISESFHNLNFHDNTFIWAKIIPSQSPKQGAESVVEIQFSAHSNKRVLQFLGCANLRVAMDFDVLADNLDPNTSDVNAHTDSNDIRGLMESQEKDWDVTYLETSHSPLVRKHAASNEFVFFHVQFFGGAIDIIARDYRLNEESLGLSKPTESLK